MPQRVEQLKRWLRNTLGHVDFQITPASSDASFRRYFRVACDGQTHIVMDAPPDREDCGPYLRVASAFLDAGLNVPRVLDSDTQLGFLLLTDMGDRLYLDALDNQTAGPLYDDAIDALLRLQRHGAGRESFLPPYDHALLIKEMTLFGDWYLGRHLGLSLGSAQQRTLDSAYDFLAASALEQPRVWVHRDYHSRNLMVTGTNNPGVLDFQDAVTGPVTYDLVSLLRDCYIAWPRDAVERWVENYFGRAQAAGLLGGVQFMALLRWFDLMGVQRHLKATGIFARLKHRDGKPGYLRDIPRTLGYVLDVSGRFPELAELRKFLDTAVVPRLAAF